MSTAITKMVMWGHTKPTMPAPTQMTPEDEVQPPLARHPERAEDLEDPDGDEEAAGEVDDGVHGGVPVADDEEAEDDRDDAAGQVPAPHLLECRADGVADGDVVVGQT